MLTINHEMQRKKEFFVEYTFFFAINIILVLKHLNK